MSTPITKTPVSVVILTLNEEVNLTPALLSVMDWADEVFVLDSGSTDATCRIAENLGAKIFLRPFDNYAAQRNHAIRELPTKNEWLYFLDADEILPTELKEEITVLVANNGNGFDGFYVKWRFIFMDRWIKHGGYYPKWILRLFRKNKATVTRGMNEHIAIDGKIGYLKNDFIHKDNKDFNFWLEKHNRYSTREALELLKENKPGDEAEFARFWGSQAQQTRWIRDNIWNKMLPPLLRPFLYFIWRYVFRMGFLDGQPGFIYHFSHALLYQFIIDVKYLEMKSHKKTPA